MAEAVDYRIIRLFTNDVPEVAFGSYWDGLHKKAFIKLWFNLWILL